MHSAATLIRTALLMLLLAPALAFAQHEQDNWYFGYHCHLHFSGAAGEAPASLPKSAIAQGEGSASISDPRTGRTLFYTDGVTVWDANDRVMTNGDSLKGDNGSTQPALIVPMPGSHTLYYIFTAAAEYNKQDGIRYSIVDMARPAVTVKNVSVLPTACEKLTAVRHANGIDFWVIVRNWQDTSFYAFPLTAEGIGEPVISHVGGYKVSNIGYLKASPDGRMLASASSDDSTSLQLLRFDNATGVISRPIDLPIDQFPYGVSFSPDSRLLYATSFSRNVPQFFMLTQYDVSSGDSASTVHSGIVISREGIPLTGLQLAPNGIIYIAIAYTPTLGRIGCPNSRGTACCFAENDPAFTLAGNCDLGLPNEIEGTGRPIAGIVPSATTICAGDSIDFTNTSFNAATWKWTFENGSPSASGEWEPHGIRFMVPGTSTVTLIITAGALADTAHVTIAVVPFPIARAGTDQSVCPGGSVRLNASGGTSYHWSPSDGLSCIDCPNPLAAPTATTTYHLTVTNEIGCSDEDSITVTVADALLVDAGATQTICAGGRAQLQADGADYYEWSPPTELNCANCQSLLAQPAVTTTYTVTGHRGSCTGVDSVTVVVNPPPVISAGSDASICAGRSVTLAASGGVRYSWSPPEGLSCTDCASPVASPSATTSYVVTGYNDSGCQALDTVVVSVHVPPTVEIASSGPLTLCDGDSILLRGLPPDEGAHWLWSTGDTTRSIVVKRSGSYGVAITTIDGCSGSSSPAIVNVLPQPSKPRIDTAGDTLIASEAEAYQWYRDGSPIPGANERRYTPVGSGSYTVVVGSRCTATSDPYARTDAPEPIRTAAWIDTATGSVGASTRVYLHLTPAVRLTGPGLGYRIAIMIPPKGLFPRGAVDVTDGRPCSLTYGTDGSLTIERNGFAGIAGGPIVALDLEGLSTADPMSRIALKSVEIDGLGAVPAVGDGLVILSGCDVGRNIGFGRRVAIVGLRPNPAHVDVTVTYRAPAGSHPALALTGIDGREALRQSLVAGTGDEQSVTITTDRIPSGFYRMELRDGIERSIAPIMVEH